MSSLWVLPWCLAVKRRALRNSQENHELPIAFETYIYLGNNTHALDQSVLYTCSCKRRSYVSVVVVCGQSLPVAACFWGAGRSAFVCVLLVMNEKKLNTFMQKKYEESCYKNILSTESVTRKMSIVIVTIPLKKWFLICSDQSPSPTRPAPWLLEKMLARVSTSFSSFTKRSWLNFAK